MMDLVIIIFCTICMFTICLRGFCIKALQVSSHLHTLVIVLVIVLIVVLPSIETGAQSII